MKTRRILSVFLAVCILLSLMPAVTLPARAAESGTISYEPDEYPEFVLFNAISGSSKTYFKSVAKETHFSAVAAGKFVDRENAQNVLSYNTEVKTLTQDFIWSDFKETALARLSDSYGQIKAGAAATLTSEKHKHSWGLHYTELTGYMSTLFGFSPALRNTICTLTGDSKGNNTLRLGETEFYSLPAGIAHIEGQSGKPLELSFMHSAILFDNGKQECHCGGKADSFVVSFCDDQVPGIRSVKITDSSGAACTNFGRNAVINITFTCSEPIRLSDNDPTGKDKVCIGLNLSTAAGTTKKYYAYLTFPNGEYDDWNFLSWEDKQ